MPIAVVTRSRQGRVEEGEGKTLGSKSERLTVTAQWQSEERKGVVVRVTWEVQAQESCDVASFSVQLKP